MSRYADAHKVLNGPGDARPTAIQIIEDEDMLGKLNGKIAIVTGSSSGIGIETARALHETDAHVILAVRDISKGQTVAKEIQESGKSKADINVMKLELDSLESVRSFAAEFKNLYQTLNLLINNAGVMACPEGSTKDGFETQFGTNHLGHFLLFQLLKDSLLASASSSSPSRVVCLTSLGHRSSPIHLNDLDLKKQGYQKWTAYGQSKTANIYMANEIERRYGSKGIHATSVHPGGIITPLVRHLDKSTMAQFETPEFNKILKSPEQGAATTVWAAVAEEWAHKGGKYLEDCQVSKPVAKTEGLTPMDPGYKNYIYDQEAAEKLWDKSNELLGLPKEE